ncbi:MAG: hypothetical protein QOE11_2747 [Solirubrobacteraceae bacterium]|jgi:hypothetical protein|nr:hypothetical protein [Solirubrobacteraceae bacterium]
MPVTSFGSSAVPTAPDAPGAQPPPTAMPAGGPVGHGVTRLVARPPAYHPRAPFIPGTPPPRGETAGAHGAHKGRISIR